eukprot:scaffold68079_cov66-Cyclotella_meneghiniana.AAC.7
MDTDNISSGKEFPSHLQWHAVDTSCYGKLGVLRLTGLQGVTVDENTYYDEDAGHATFEDTIDQGDTFAKDIKLGPVVDEEG